MNKEMEKIAKSDALDLGEPGAAKANGNGSDLLELTAQVVSNHLSNNPVEAKEIPALIREVHTTLQSLNGIEATGHAQLNPAVPVEDSIQPDYIVCLEDGKQLKMLKRYLRTKYGLTPEEYKRRWSLPPDYPLVAPNYAKKRHELAKSIGLGKNR